MATRTTLNVSLPLELGRFVEHQVHSGDYASASEVVRAALRVLREREAGRGGAVAHPSADPEHKRTEENVGSS